MSHYTPILIFRWMLLGPRAWLLLALVMGLVIGLSLPTAPAPRAPWVWSAESRPGWFWLHPSRLGRWVWRWVHLVQATGWRVICRTILIAGLVAGSELATPWPWVGHLIWLPVVDWTLGLAGWMWPQLGDQWGRSGAVWSCVNATGAAWNSNRSAGPAVRGRIGYGCPGSWSTPLRPATSLRNGC
jgi:hypothetical protein